LGFGLCHEQLSWMLQLDERQILSDKSERSTATVASNLVLATWNRTV
jgi:hypothetical protein